MTPENQKALEALDKLAALMPVRPKAITYDLGTEILNCVQDELEPCFATFRAALTRPPSAEVVEALEAALEYFEQRQDADGHETGFTPNEEMGLATQMKEALALLGATDEGGK